MSRRNSLVNKKTNRGIRKIKRENAKRTIPTVPNFYIPGYDNYLYLESQGLIKPKENEAIAQFKGDEFIGIKE